AVIFSTYSAVNISSRFKIRIEHILKRINILCINMLQRVKNKLSYIQKSDFSVNEQRHRSLIRRIDYRSGGGCALVCVFDACPDVVTRLVVKLLVSKRSVISQMKAVCIRVHLFRIAALLLCFNILILYAELSNDRSVI